MQYTATIGHPKVREQVAAFMSKYLCHVPIGSEHIAFAAGASAIIEVSSFVLADPGDVVVIPAPSYPMYTKDLGLKSGMERFDLQTHIDLEDHGSQGPVTTVMLDDALKKLTTQRKKFRMLLITSPDNPTGCIYSASQLRDLAAWCVQHQVHLVVNEIYGLSLINIHDDRIAETFKEDIDLTSFASTMAEMNSPYLHLWYAMSKDFAMSGLRFGIVHSLNDAFITGFSNANIPHMVSNLTQWIVGQLLSDQEFIKEYILRNQRSLTESYAVVAQTLELLRLPYIPARGSLFVWADFSRFLTDHSSEGEQQLWMDIFHHSGVLLTPGKGFGHQKKGIFRIVHTALSTAHLQVAMERMVEYLRSR